MNNYYWHFLRSDCRLRYGSGEKVIIKHTLTIPIDQQLYLCAKGFHASKRIINAVYYAPGPIACLVLLHGKIIEGSDKVVAQGRTVIDMVDASDILHEFVCVVAEKENPKEKEIRRMINLKRKWIQDKKGLLNNYHWNSYCDSYCRALMMVSPIESVRCIFDAACDTNYKYSKILENMVLRKMGRK